MLSEVPDEWRRQVGGWSRLLRARLGDVEGRAPPNRDDEYMFYHMLVGSWPMDMLDSPTAEGLDAYHSRIRIALEKSLREGKQRSSWTSPDLDYEAAMHAFTREALRPEGGFLTSFLPFVERIARLGVQNSLVQTTLKLTAPGVPDLYQGCELWDLSLVDPDNRRTVDYLAREAAFAALAPRLETEDERAELFELAAAKLARRADQARCDRASARLPARSRRALRRGRLSADRGDGRGCGLGARFRPGRRPASARCAGRAVSGAAGREAGLAGARANARGRMVRSRSRTAL